MKILFDTSVIVEIDRQKPESIAIIKEVIKKKDELVISTITVGEIITGSYLMRNPKEARLKAKEILSQFVWKEVDGETAEKIAELLSYLIIEKKNNLIEYPDIIIAASYFSAHCDAFITLNKKDFILFPQLKDKVFTPEEFKRKFLFSLNS